MHATVQVVPEDKITPFVAQSDPHPVALFVSKSLFATEPKLQPTPETKNKVK